MRFQLITRTKVYNKSFINRRPGESMFLLPGRFSDGLEATQLYGADEDSYLSLRRLLKCHLFTAVAFTLFQIIW